MRYPSTDRNKTGQLDNKRDIIFDICPPHFWNGWESGFILCVSNRDHHSEQTTKQNIMSFTRGSDKMSIYLFQNLHLFCR